MPVPVLLRRAALQFPEAGREVALGGKPAFQRDLRDAQIGFAKELSALTNPVLQEVGKQRQPCRPAEKTAAFAGTQMDVPGCSESVRIREKASVRRRPSGVLLSKRETEDVDN